MNLESLKVADVITEPKLHFDVQLAIKPNISIPRGSTVVLGTRLAGGGFIDVRPPEESQGILSNEERLELEPAVDVQNVLESVNALVVDLKISSHAGNLLKIQNRVLKNVSKMSTSSWPKFKIFSPIQTIILHVDEDHSRY